MYLHIVSKAPKTSVPNEDVFLSFVSICLSIAAKVLITINE